MTLCEMTKKDFAIGQTVYLKAINDNARYLKEGEVNIVEATVSKIGSVLLYVDYKGSSYKFRIQNNFRQSIDIGSPDWLLLLNIEQLEEEKKAKEYTRKIKSIFDYSDCEFSLDALKRICC